ncbi:putative outer dynein arm docking complex [Trypanosoma conorhini]|uniref:Putative outer dynein arm docking complex n=1 Tax=Trypanosoma conorhini TaxID=83891 RepID=A0A422Q712_9TRYP|nr:putative outer dynein arm docking complex [Trypanosoma conorhini]RNF25734.1 putative outer dynein arm docking complex [Trypanosoma conorhini]
MATNSAAAEADARRSQVAGGIVAAQAEVIRQEEAMRQLTADNEKLKKEIAAVSGVPYDYVKADKFAALKGEVDALERRYQFEKMKKNELTRQYQLARIDLLQSRRLKGGVNAERENAEALQRQVDILENRLDQALTRFNDAISYNKELRDHIDIIREERRVFQRVYKRMEDDLGSKKKLMSERIEQSNKDLDERDGYLRQVEQLQKAIKEQKQEYDGKVQELDAAMVEIGEMRKEQQRLQIELEARQYELDNTDSMAATNATGAGDTGPKRRQLLDDKTETAKEDLTEGGETDPAVEDEPDINEVLRQLHEFSQNGDMVSLAKEYESLGDTNFSLYKYVNELTTNREEMERDIRTLKSVIAAEHESEAKQKCLIKGLEERLAQTEGLLESLHVSTEKHKEVLANIRVVTEEIFHELGCSMGDAPKSFLANDHCTESNHLQFLGKIEERATSIMYAFQRHRRKEARMAELATEEESKRILALQEGAPVPTANAAEEEGEELMKTALAETARPPEEGIAGASAEDAPALTPTAEAKPHDGAREGAGAVEAMALTIEEEGPPFVPMLNMPGEQGVNAVRLVRHLCLPSAHLGSDEGVEVLEEGEGDRVVSHEEVRRQMERRLLSKREREERAHRRRRELKEQLAGQTTAPRKR